MLSGWAVGHALLLPFATFGLGTGPWPTLCGQRWALDASPGPATLQPAFFSSPCFVVLGVMLATLWLFGWIFGL